MRLHHGWWHQPHPGNPGSCPGKTQLLTAAGEGAPHQRQPFHPLQTQKPLSWALSILGREQKGLLSSIPSFFSPPDISIRHCPYRQGPACQQAPEGLCFLENGPGHLREALRVLQDVEPWLHLPGQQDYSGDGGTYCVLSTSHMLGMVMTSSCVCVRVYTYIMYSPYTQ